MKEIYNLGKLSRGGPVERLMEHLVLGSLEDGDLEKVQKARPEDGTLGVELFICGVPVSFKKAIASIDDQLDRMIAEKAGVLLEEKLGDDIDKLHDVTDSATSAMDGAIQLMPKKLGLPDEEN